MSAADKAWRTVGFVGELTAATVAGLLELLSPRDKSGEHFAGAAASLAVKGKPSYGYDRTAREDKQRDLLRSPAGPHTTSQPSPVTTRTSAGDSSAAAGTLPPTVAAEPLDDDVADLQAFADAIPFGWASIDVGELIAEAQAELAEWLKPAILDVLAEHAPRLWHLTGDVYCGHDDGSELVCSGWDDWREHVGDDLAPHIVKALRAQPK